MITYSGFIQELERLVPEAKKLRSAKKMHEDERFRKWRNELHSLLSQIVQVNYLLPCPVRESTRRYGSTTNVSLTDAEIFKSYQTEIDDTINEMELIIDSYKKHGEPPRRDTGSSGLEMPKVITASWLFHHAPYGLWLKIGAILITIFGFGVFIGQTEIYQRAASLFATKEVEKNGKQP